MKTKNKKLLISAFATVASVCMAVPCFMGLNAAQASADEVPMAGKTEFVVANGVSVRTVEGSSGIRYTTKIDKDFYESLVASAEQAGTTVTWGSIIGYEVEDASTLTLAAVEEEGGNYLRVFSPKDAAGNAVTIVPEWQDEDDPYSGYYVYSTVITYNALTGEAFANACDMALNVRSYYTVGGETTYSHVDAETDTYRSISQAAEMVLVQDRLGNQMYDAPEAADAKFVLQSYVQANSNKEIALTSMAYSETADATVAGTSNKLTHLGASDGEYALTVNGVDLGAQTVAGGELALSDEDAATLAAELTLGEKYVITLEGINVKYTQEMKYVSDTVNNLEDFIAVTRRYGESTGNGNTTYDATTFKQRFYVMTDNIVSTGTNDFTKQWSNDWYDILDGQGFSITANKLWARGLFGSILKGGVVKNLSVTAKALHTDQALQSNVFAYDITAGIISNVSVNVSFAAETAYTYNIIARTINWNTQLRDVFIYLNDNVVISDTTARHGYIGGYWTPDMKNVANYVSNVQVVTSKISLLGKDDTTRYVANNDTAGDGETQVPAGTISRYDTVAKLKEANVTKVGNWLINDDGSATWQADAAVSSGQNVIPVVIDRNEFVVNSNEVTWGASATEHTYGTLQIPVPNVQGALTSVYWNDTELTGATLDGTTVVLSKFPTEGLGLVHTLTVNTDAGTYEQPFRYISGEIASVSDYRNMIFWYGSTQTYDASSFRQKYYVMTEDIELTGTNTQCWNGRIYDVIDGQGHDIKVSGTLYGCGVFGQILASGAVKNLSVTATGGMEDNTVTNAQYKAGILASHLYGTIENVAIHYAFTEERARYHQGIAGYTYTGATLKNVYMYMNDYTTLADDTANEGANRYGMLGSLYAVKEENVSNVYLVSKHMTYLIKQGTTYYVAENEYVEGTTVGGVAVQKYENAYRYDTIAELKASVTRVGNWVIGNDGIATYDITCNASATYAIDGEKTEYVAIENGTGVAVTGATEVTVADTSVVTYANGKLTAVSEGKTVIVVDGTVVYVEVVTPKVEGITVGEITLAVGETEEISTKYGAIVFGGYVACSVSDSSVVEVNGTSVTAIGAGEATLQVAYQVNGVVRVTEITVTVTEA